MQSGTFSERPTLPSFLQAIQKKKMAVLASDFLKLLLLLLWTAEFDETWQHHLPSLYFLGAD